MQHPPTARARSLVVVVALAAIWAWPTEAVAQVKVIISGGFSAAYKELLPEFERASGVTVTTTSGGSVGTGSNTIPGQIRRGVPADVIILAREGLGGLIAEGRTVPGTDVDLARSIIGLAVRSGAPKPDISTVEKLKQALLGAKSVTMSSSTSGVYLTTTLFPKLGIAAEMAAKSTSAGATAVSRGEAELALQQVSELLPVPGLDFVAAIPDEVQYVTTYAAAVVAGSTQLDASKRLIAFLSGGGASAAVRRSGMEPPRTARSR